MSTAQDNKITINGEVVEVLPSTKFQVELTNGHTILCYLGGKMRRHYIKLTEGDWVTVDFSPYDLTKGRIIRRLDESESRRLSRAKQQEQAQSHESASVSEKTV